MAMTAPSQVLGEGREGRRRETSRPAPVYAVPGPKAPSGILRRLLILETVTLSVVWTIALVAALEPVWPESTTATVIGLVASVLALTVSGLVMAAVLQLYRSRVSALRSVTVERQALLAATSTLEAIALLHLFAPTASTTPVIIGGFALFVGLAVGRSGFDSWLTVLRRTGAIGRPVVLVGEVEEVSALVHLLASHPEIGYRPMGFVAPSSDLPAGAEGDPQDLPWLGPLCSAAEAVRQTGATGAIIAASGLPSTQLNALVRQLHTEGIHVHLSSGLERIGHRRVRQLPMAHEPFFYLEAATPGRWALGVKRGMDIAGALFVLVLASPIMLITAAMVKLSDRGPVFFYQHRVGKDGEPVVVRKFRSMTVTAESDLSQLEADNERNGPLFKLTDDPRVTRVGKWIRVTSIDELPQLLNVLEGTLSMVGPRPALPSEVAQFDEELLGRLRMRPGVSGLWQVEARHNPSFFAYRHLDLFYVENWRLSLDIAVLAATIHTVIGDSVRAMSGAIRSRLSRRKARRSPVGQITPAIDELGAG